MNKDFWRLSRVVAKVGIMANYADFASPNFVQADMASVSIGQMNVSIYLVSISDLWALDIQHAQP